MKTQPRLFIVQISKWQHHLPPCCNCSQNAILFCIFLLPPRGGVGDRVPLSSEVYPGVLSPTLVFDMISTSELYGSCSFVSLMLPYLGRSAFTSPSLFMSSVPLDTRSSGELQEESSTLFGAATCKLRSSWIGRFRRRPSRNCREMLRAVRL